MLNHCSDQHPWFLEAKKSRENPFHDYFLWKDGDGITPPNEMRACFGGPAWTDVPEIGQWYFHQFAPQQPDLNWTNPAMRQALYRAIRFWVDKGVEGFRLDVIDQIGKDPDLQVTGNGPRLHEYLRELSAAAFQEPGIVTVGEAWGADVERAKLYSNPDCSELSMVFQFQHIGLDQQEGKEKWDTKPLYLPDLKRCLAHWQNGLHGCGWNSLFMNNHDLPRVVSRWGNDGVYRVKSAKMLATMLHGMEGTPYIYQGEELGMTNIKLPIGEYRDLEILNMYTERMAKGYREEDVMASIYARGRDNARTPMQWTDSENAGFTTGTPWMPLNPNYHEINAEQALADPDSVFHYYRRLIHLRKTTPVICHGDFTLLDADNEKVFSYVRRDEEHELLVVCNFTDETLAYPVPAEFGEAEMMLCNDDCHHDGTLKPYEAFMLIK